MIQSMTGYGQHSFEFGNKKIVIEIKSLNSKQADIFTRLNPLYKEKELEIRSLLSSALVRGKIDFILYVEQAAETAAPAINNTIFQSYIRQIELLAQENRLEMPKDLFSIILKMPEVLKSESQVLVEEEWSSVKKEIFVAIEKFNSFRNQEGEMLAGVFIKNIEQIRNLLSEIEPFETERVEKIRTRLSENLSALSIEGGYDSNRLEQELIFYIEKLDINEEKSRLINHLDYFLETMRNEESPGRKLGFIAQEIGREINTMGSKSNHASMQQIVIQMKDGLEQIKEQILNVL